MAYLAVVTALVAACGNSKSASTPSGIDAGGLADASIVDGGADTSSPGTDASLGGIGGARPVGVHVPPGYVPGTPMPLVLAIHGYSGTGGEGIESYMKLTPLADARGFLYAHPDGTADGTGNLFWNGTDACCDLFASGIDDSTYLSRLIDQIKAHFTVDPKRVFLVGHSNGAFMTFRMACDHADQIAAIATLAGATYKDVTKCTPKTPVAVLHIHGNTDDRNAYGGGTILAPYPGAEEDVTDWAAYDGCSTTPDTSTPPLDLDTNLAGAETTITKYAGCKPGGHVELWKIEGGSHVPALTPSFAPSLIDFFFAHPKP